MAISPPPPRTPGDENEWRNSSLHTMVHCTTYSVALSRSLRPSLRSAVAGTTTPSAPSSRPDTGSAHQWLRQDSHSGASALARIGSTAVSMTRHSRGAAIFSGNGSAHMRRPARARGGPPTGQLPSRVMPLRSIEPFLRSVIRAAHPRSPRSMPPRAAQQARRFRRRPHALAPPQAVDRVLSDLARPTDAVLHVHEDVRRWPEDALARRGHVAARGRRGLPQPARDGSLQSARVPSGLRVLLVADEAMQQDVRQRQQHVDAHHHEPAEVRRQGVRRQH